jgi:hypothetical protein
MLQLIRWHPATDSCIRCNGSNRLPRRVRATPRVPPIGGGRLALGVPGGIRTVGTPLVTSLTAGVDLRTVAGRLGHGGCGATTLKVYAAWVAASDRKAAEILGPRMPKRGS